MAEKFMQKCFVMAQQSSRWGLLIGLQMTITIHYTHSCLMTFALIAILFRLFNNRVTAHAHTRTSLQSK